MPTNHNQSNLKASLGYVPQNKRRSSSSAPVAAGSSSTIRKQPMKGSAHRHLSRVLNQQVQSSASIPTKYECIINPKKQFSDGFGSRTNRFEKRKHDLAGPGTYFKPEERDLVKQSPSLSKKGYGAVVSKDRRWYQSPGPTFNPPGPGGYDVDNSFKAVHDRRSGSMAYGATQPSSVFVKPSTKSLNHVNPQAAPIGPGSYEVNGPRYSDSYKNQSTSQFKSRTQRGVRTPKRVDKHPSQVKAPYKMTTANADTLAAEEEAMRERQRDRTVYRDTLLPSSVFRSGTKRGAQLPTGVGPGYYNPPISTEVHSTKKKIKSSSVFANTGRLDRFGNPMIRFTRRMEAPAPGDYDIPSSFDLSEHDGLTSARIPKSSVFLSRTNRFGNLNGSKAAPAPGQYDGAQRGSLLKRSYNIQKKGSWHP